MIINDAIHGVIDFGDQIVEDIKPVIDQPLFQRLRHIKQVGMVDLVFPSATHTRFNHSLGCAYLAYRFAKALDLDEMSLRLAVVSALVHDIGHGPFSHAFEGLLKTSHVSVHHEDWTPYFLQELDLPETHIIKTDHHKIRKFIAGEKDHAAGSDDNLIADIVSSQLDADRMDYLLRDSHFCGVSFGEIDHDWIINKLVRITDLPSSPRLGIDFKAVNSVENYLLARRLMNRGIYNHPIALLYEELFLTLMNTIVRRLDYIQQLPNSFLKDFLQLAHEFKAEALKKDDFIQKAFPFYKKLADYDIWMLIRSIASYEFHFDEDTINIATQLYHREKNYKILRLNQRHKEVDDKTFAKVKQKYHLEPWQLLSLSASVQTYRRHQSSLYIQETGRKSSDLTKHSHIMQYLGGKQEHYRYLAIHKSLDIKKITKAFGLFS